MYLNLVFKVLSCPNETKSDVTLPGAFFLLHTLTADKRYFLNLLMMNLLMTSGLCYSQFLLSPIGLIIELSFSFKLYPIFNKSVHLETMVSII